MDGAGALLRRLTLSRRVSFHAGGFRVVRSSRPPGARRWRPARRCAFPPTPGPACAAGTRPSGSSRACAVAGSTPTAATPRRRAASSRAALAPRASSRSAPLTPATPTAAIPAILGLPAAVPERLLHDRRLDDGHRPPGQPQPALDAGEPGRQAHRPGRHQPQRRIRPRLADRDPGPGLDNRRPSTGPARCRSRPRTHVRPQSAGGRHQHTHGQAPADLGRDRLEPARTSRTEPDHPARREPRRGHRYIVALRNLRDKNGNAAQAGNSFRLYRDNLHAQTRQVEGAPRPLRGALQDARRRRDRAQGPLPRLGLHRCEPAQPVRAPARDPRRRLREASSAACRPRSQAASAMQPGRSHVRAAHRRSGYAVGHRLHARSQDSQDRPPGRGQVQRALLPELPSCDSGLAASPRPGRRHTARTAIPGNTEQASFTCNIPRVALEDGTPGDTRLSLYGHGLLGSRGEVEPGPAQGHGPEHNFVFCATEWSGWRAPTCRRRPRAVALDDRRRAIRRTLPTATCRPRWPILHDLSNFPKLADRVQQGMLDFMYLGRLMRPPAGLRLERRLQDAGGTSILDTTRALLRRQQPGRDHRRLAGRGGARPRPRRARRAGHELLDAAPAQRATSAPDADAATQGVQYATRSTSYPTSSSDRSSCPSCSCCGTAPRRTATRPHDDRPAAQHAGAQGDAARRLRRPPGGRRTPPRSRPGRSARASTGPCSTAPAPGSSAGRPARRAAPSSGFRRSRSRGTDRPSCTGTSGPSGPRRAWPGDELWGGTRPRPTDVPNRLGDDPHEFPRRAALAQQQKSDFLKPDGQVTDVCHGPCHAGSWAGP